jgi:hypothetical protein
MPHRSLGVAHFGRETYGEVEPGSTISFPKTLELQHGLFAAQELAKRALSEQATAHASTGIPRFSLQPLSALKHMTIKDLKGGVLHLGRYILLRVISDPVQLKGLSAIVHDKEGTHCCLTIHNLMPEGPAEPGAAAAALPLESILAVKVSYSGLGPILVLLRCRSRSCAAVLTELAAAVVL